MGLNEFLFGFRGRINRLQYLGATIVIGVIVALMVMLLGTVYGSYMQSTGLGAQHFGSQVVSMIALATLVGAGGLLWIGLALQAKRLHDFGASAYWVIALFLGVLVLPPLGPAGMVLLLASNLTILMLPGSGRSNPHGPASGGTLLGTLPSLSKARREPTNFGIDLAAAVAVIPVAPVPARVRTPRSSMGRQNSMARQAGFGRRNVL